jgi:sterol 3beta-glucosyltransferase
VLYPVGDELFWGKLAHQQRVALPPVPLKQWSEAQATQGFLSLWQEEEMQAASKAQAARIQREDGLAAAVDFLEAHWQKP